VQKSQRSVPRRKRTPAQSSALKGKKLFALERKREKKRKGDSGRARTRDFDLQKRLLRLTYSFKRKARKEVFC